MRRNLSVNQSLTLVSLLMGSDACTVELPHGIRSLYGGVDAPSTRWIHCAYFCNFLVLLQLVIR